MSDIIHLHKEPDDEVKEILEEVEKEAEMAAKAIGEHMDKTDTDDIFRHKKNERAFNEFMSDLNAFLS